MIEININTYDKIDPTVIQQAIDITLDRLGPKIAQEAKNIHRYKSQTGNLERATKYNKSKNGAKIYIDDVKAKYGKYIHDGFKKWAPDQFIDKAVDNNMELIEITLADEIDRILGVK
jgi:hypothetical protein